MSFRSIANTLLWNFNVAEYVHLKRTKTFWLFVKFSYEISRILFSELLIVYTAIHW